MSPAEPDRSDRSAAVVAICFAAQMMVIVANVTLPTIAPEVARALDLHPSVIGYQVSLLFGAAAVGTQYGGAFVARFGACRTTQITVGFTLTGCLLMALGNVFAIAAGSLAAGFGQGLINSAAAELISRHTLPRSRNLMFSLKQTGVPFGGALTSLCAPAIALAWGWQWAFAPMVFASVALIAYAERYRADWDRDRDPRAPLGLASAGGAGLVWRTPRLRWLALVGFAFAVVQRIVLTFTVVFLVAECGYDLVEAGIMVSVVQVGGVIGRVFWGWVADRFLGGYAVLVIICTLTLLASLALVAFGPTWPRWSAYGLYALFGLASMGWNGVHHAEAAPLPPGTVGLTAGGTTFFLFFGVMLGPSLFSALYGQVGSYGTTFWTMVLAALASYGLLWLCRRDAARP